MEWIILGTFGGLSVLTLIILLYKIQSNKKIKAKSRKLLSEKKRQKNQYFSKKTYAKLAKFFDNNFIFRQEYKNTKEKYANMSVYTTTSIELLAVNSVLVSNLTFVAFITLGVIMFQDVFAVMLMIVYAYVLKDIFIFKALDSTQYKVLCDLSMALSNIRQEYIKNNSIPDAILDAQVSPLLRGSFNSIYGILSSYNQTQKLDEFYATTPFRILQTFAGVCYIVNDTGDSITQSGSSNFIEALSMMTAEINLEIRKITATKAAFGRLELLPLAPIFSLGFLEKYFQNIIPGLSSMFRGPYGYVMRVLILLSSLIAYTIISKINSSNATAKDDRNPFCLRLLKFDWFKKIVKDIKPKRGRRLRKLTKMLKGSLTCKTIEHVYGLKLMFSTACLIFSVIVCLLCIDLGKSFIYSNYNSLGLITADNLTQTEYDQRVKMDKELLSIKTKPSTEKLEKLLTKYVPGLKDYKKLDQLDRLSKKWDLYNAAQFKYWMLLICYGVGVLGWFIPDLTLKARLWLLSTEAEEDIMQIQTMICILMNTSYDTLETINWLSRQSRVHKNALLEAYHNYPSDPDLALERLKNKAPSPTFHRMVDKLKLTISRIELKEAFGDLITERDHVLRMREITQQEVIKKKRSRVSFLSLLPLALVILCYIFIPLGWLGWQEFSKTMGSL